MLQLDLVFLYWTFIAELNSFSPPQFRFYLGRKVNIGSEERGDVKFRHHNFPVSTKPPPSPLLKPDHKG